MRINRNELRRPQFTRAIKKQLPIAEIKLSTGEVVFSVLLPKHKEYELLDSYTIPKVLAIVEDKKKPGTFKQVYVDADIRSYTTFLKESGKIVYGKVRVRAYSMKLEREINKTFVFEIGSWDTLYGDEGDGPNKLKEKISTAKDNVGGFSFDETLIHSEYRVDNFIEFNNKQVF